MKSFILSFLLALCINLHGSAQSHSLPDPEAYFSAIIVDDIDKSMDWYSSVLGFKVLSENSNTERGFSQANMGRGDVLIELIAIQGSLSQEELKENNPDLGWTQGFFKFGLRVDEFDRWVEFLRVSEVELKGSVVTDELSGNKMLIILDPDANRIQLFEK